MYIPRNPGLTGDAFNYMLIQNIALKQSPLAGNLWSKHLIFAVGWGALTGSSQRPSSILMLETSLPHVIDSVFDECVESNCGQALLTKASWAERLCVKHIRLTKTAHLFR